MSFLLSALRRAALAAVTAACLMTALVCFTNPTVLHTTVGPDGKVTTNITFHNHPFPEHQ